MDIPTKEVFVYIMTIEPVVTNKDHKRRLYELLELHPDFESIARYSASDYADKIISTRELKIAATGPKGDIQIVVHDDRDLDYDDSTQPKGKKENVNPTASAEKGKYTFKIELKKMIKPIELQEYIKGNLLEHKIEDVYEMFQALNIMIAKFARQDHNIVTVGRDKIFSLADEALHKSIGDGLVVMKGFYTSVRPTLEKMVLNVNVCTAVFRQGGKLSDVINNFTGSRRGSREKKYQELNSFLRGTTVTYNYLGRGRAYTRKIVGITSTTPGNTEFMYSDPITGRTTKRTVEEYLRIGG